MNRHHIRNLYLKFIQRRSSREENDLLVKLLKASKDDSALPNVDDVNLLFGERRSMDDTVSDHIFDRIVNSTSAVSVPITTSISRRSYQSPWFAAASLTLFILISLSIYTMKPQMLTYSSGFAQKRTYRLTDGSVVVLNANSRISINRSFNENTKREVWVEGEAFFSVAHNKNKPFIVHTPRGMDVEVLGTEFNVNSREWQSEVVLNRGRVKVMLAEERGSAVNLVPGEMAKLDAGKRQLYKAKVDTIYYSSWKYNLLPFKDEPLSKVVQSIKDVYGYEVIFAKKGQDTLHFTGSIPSNNLGKVIKTLASVLNADIKISDKRIYINQL